MPQLKNLLENNKYQVFLVSSACAIPHSFFEHYWFVTNNKGKIHRWEVLQRQNMGKNGKNGHGYVYQDIMQPMKGLRIIPGTSFIRWKPRVRHYVEGGKNSLANKMVNFLEKEAFNYPNSHYYNFLVVNSNTFINWVLEQFPEFDFKLSWRAYGKNGFSQKT